jgi:FecR protein
MNKRISNRSIAFVAASVMLGLGLLASSPARADGSVGSVTQISGNAQIERGGATLAAQQGTPVMVHDKVSTQPGASVTLEFNDGSSIVLIGSTSVAVEDMTAVNGQPVPSHVTLISGDIGTIVPDEAGEPHSVEVTSPNAKAIGASPNQ